MKLKKLFIGLLSIMFVITISACNNNQEIKTTNPPINTTNNNLDKYSEKDVNVLYVDDSYNQKTKLRFYEDTLDIPYIGINQYYNILIKKTPLAALGGLKITKDNNIYKIETPRGGIAYVDSTNDTFESDNYALFNSTNYNVFNGTTSIFQLDGQPWIKVKSVSYDKKPYKFFINFKDYDIDIFADDNDVYFPFNTASDLFLNDNMLNCAYNQEDIYVINRTDGEDISNFSDYIKPIFKNKLSNKYSKYNYMELCLLYDKLLGRPNRSSIERNFNLEKGLDYALSNNEVGKIAKDLFLSSEMKDYFVATQIFDGLFSDGGHSTYFQLLKYVECLSIDQQISFYNNENTDIVNKLTEIKNKGYHELIDVEARINERLALRTSREKMLALTLDPNIKDKSIFGTNSYYRNGDTAIIFIDNFTGEFNNMKLWNDYYNGKREDIPYSDTLGGCATDVYYGLLKAKEDNVKNLIIDLSSNTGGSLDELAYLCAILTNNKKMSIYNHLTGQIMNAEFDIDINFDKTIDDKDNIDLVSGFNLAVLTSKNGFSCGGISPIYLHEANIFTIGDESGGGSCSIYQIFDCYGLPHIASSPHQIYTLNGASIDSIRNNSCDLYIDTHIVDGVKNYDEFYNLDKLNEYINQHYKIS